MFLTVGAAYAGGSQLAFWWFNANGVGATFFPPAGVTLAALVLTRVRWWPFVLGGAASAELLLDTAHGLGLVEAAGYAVANTVEPVVGATLLRAVLGRPDLERLRDLAGFLACAVVAAPAVGGAIGATNFVLNDGDGWLRFVRSWWIGDGLGVLVVGGAILAAAGSLRIQRGWSGRAQAAALPAAVVASTAVVFWLEQAGLAFVPFALLLVIAFRLGTWAVAVAGAGAAIVAAHATAYGHVFWESLAISPADGLVYLQLVLAFLVATPLLLAAALRSRELATAELSSAERRAVLADASAALAAATTEQEVVETVVAVGRARLGAVRGTLALLEGDQIVARFPGDADAAEAAQRMPRLPHESPAGDAIRSNARIEVASLADLRARYPLVAERFAAGGVESFAVVPLPPVPGSPKGAIGLSFVGGRRLAGEEWELLESLAGNVAQAVARARLHGRLEEQAHAARILSRIGEGIVQVDADRRVRAWNLAAAAITGVSADEALGADVAAVFPGWDELERRVAADPAQPARRVVLPADAGERGLWLSVAAVAYGDGVVYAFRDVTAEHDLDELKRDFIATTSHELRTPLSGIYGAALTLARGDLDLSAEARASLLGMMVDECRRLVTLVDEILLARKLETDALRLVSADVDVAELLDDVARAHRPALPPHTRLAVDGAAGVTLQADPDRLRQVLSNLLDNAIKYSPEGGTITLSAARVRGHVVLRVADEGVGIPPQEQERVFDRFYRLDPGQSRGVGGSGLGLYICRELVTRMGGTIDLESQPGGGTTVCVRLPA